MKAPFFWQQYPPTPTAKILTPFSFITSLITRYQINKPGWHAPIPVLCCGNLTIGGTGKTTVALEMGHYCQQQSIPFAFLTRGYKRKSRIAEPFMVDLNQHNAKDVGDEALLLARLAPTWIGGNRAASAKAAIKKSPVKLLIMDDGLQNPTLYKDLSILVVDGVTGFGNQRLLPAGPLRQPVIQGLKTVKTCIFIGKDKTGLLPTISSHVPVFRANLTMNPAIRQFSNQSVIAFAGIGRPEKFFQTLKDNQLILSKTISFPDHHNYTNKDLNKLLSLHRHYQLPLVTTPKDYVRLPDQFRPLATPLEVCLTWHDPASLQKLFHMIHF